MKRDTIKARRISNQAVMDKAPCYEVPIEVCRYSLSCFDSGGRPANNWWHESGQAPCFLSSHNLLKDPIHRQDPLYLCETGLSYLDKIKKYNAGKYRMPIPPVCHANWTVGMWINWIDNRGEWL